MTSARSALFALLLLTIANAADVCAEAHGGGARSFGLGRRSCEQAAGSGGCLPRGPSPRAAKRAADARGRGDCTPAGPCGGGPPAAGGRPATAAVPDRRLHSARTDPLSRWRSLRRYPDLRASAGSRAGQSGADRESGDVAERDRAARQVHAALRRSLHCDVRGAEGRSARGQDHRDAGSVLLAHRHRARRLSQWHSDGGPVHERAVPRRDALTYVGGRIVRRANPRADARCRRESTGARSRARARVHARAHLQSSLREVFRSGSTRGSLNYSSRTAAARRRKRPGRSFLSKASSERSTASTMRRRAWRTTRASPLLRRSSIARG